MLLLAEEMIKAEMLTMMHFDNLQNPLPISKFQPPPSGDALSSLTSTGSTQQQVQLQKKLFNQSRLLHEAHLRDNPYEELKSDEMKQ
ncbi:unnamed protein product, partial [Protopolystoma xenopodis]